MLFSKPKTKDWPKWVRNKATPELARDELGPGEAYITYINHASHLIQIKGQNIITDPIFSKRAGPAMTGLGPNRVREPGLALKKLPQINVVLVSHNHYDHMDLPSLSKLKKRFNPLFIVPIGNKKYLQKRKIENVVELDWWESYEMGNTTITLVPAIHWSRRTIGDINQALWGGFWIEAEVGKGVGTKAGAKTSLDGQNLRSVPLKIYFSGDTGYGNIFQVMKEKLGNPDISILPIGSYEPRWFMKMMHMNPEEAVLASRDLESTLSLATHYQTFRLSHESIHDPVVALKEGMKKYGVREEEFLAPETGETIKWPR